MIRMSQAAFAKLAGGKIAKGTLKPTEMNGTERKYDEYLMARQLAGEIPWYKYEPFRLRLADNTTYTPDFGVMESNGELECIDVKGSKFNRETGRETYWCMEDSKIKVKMAAELFPFRFVIAFLARSGVWKREVIG